MTEREREYRVLLVPSMSPRFILVTAEDDARAKLVAKRRCEPGERVAEVTRTDLIERNTDDWL